jgi:hypothetical protein
MLKAFYVLLFIAPIFLFAQNILEVNSFNKIPSALENLNESAYFKENALENHLAVDMVNAFTTDSVFTRKFERHRVFGGGVIRLLGFRWKAVTLEREKLVGWVNKHYLHDIDKKAQFTEYDINYDLIPVLPAYKDMAHLSYQAQFNMFKSKKKDQEGQAPYIYPTEGVDMTLYRFHCENTPAADFRSLLNTKFFPVHNNNPLAIHQNFETEKPVIGMYGVLVLDCNHSCHPEIHPYEWVWWLNLTEKSTSWNVGFIRDVSNRFKHWSSAPRTGEISIPFSFPLESSEWKIEVDHQMFGNFSQEGFKELQVPKPNYTFKELERTFQFSLPALADKTLQVVSGESIPYESLVYYFSNLNLDVSSGTFSGNLHLAMSINEVYTAEIKSSYK